MRIHKKFERARAGRILTDLLFPRRCPVCDRPVKPFGRDICDGCRGTLILIREPRCLKCGKQLQDAGAEYCYDCSRRRHVYTKGAALYSYACIRQTIYRFKYAGRREYADFLGRALAENLGTLIRSWHPDALVPVPLHPDRERIRGYNQAALLAQELGKRLNIPVLSDWLVMVKNTSPQKALEGAARQNNLKNAKLTLDRFRIMFLTDQMFQLILNGDCRIFFIGNFDDHVSAAVEIRIFNLC